MKKAVLIIDLPENCRDCPFFGYECRLTRNRCNWYNEDGRHETCPLQELPGPMEVCGRYPQPGTVPSYRIGWNACLDKITEDCAGGRSGCRGTEVIMRNRRAERL